ncbi:hypothetical protein CesoFtcFv8_008084 [Champsocephalus esox]|nr:hypothetical protein CesoFtcFv8_008084 [Champsocephalus esox]
MVVREVEENVEDSEGHLSDEGNMSDVWNSGDSEREESGNEEQEVQRQKEKDLLFEREMREKAATRARREELKGWKRISVNIGKVNDKGVWVECKENVHLLRVRPFGGRKGETVAIWRDMWEKRKVKVIAVTRVDVDEGNWGW